MRSDLCTRFPRIEKNGGGHGGQLQSSLAGRLLFLVSEQIDRALVAIMDWHFRLGFEPTEPPAPEVLQSLAARAVSLLEQVCAACEQRVQPQMEPGSLT